MSFEAKPTALRGGNGVAIYHNGDLVAELHEDPDTRKPFIFAFGDHTVCRDYTGPGGSV